MRALRDYARFGQLYLDHGKVDGVEVIPAAWVEATRNGDHALFREPYTQSLPQGAYRNQFWIEDPQSRSIMARGVFGQLIYINWDHRARRGEAVELARFSQCELQHRDAEGHPRHRCRSSDGGPS